MEFTWPTRRNDSFPPAANSQKTSADNSHHDSNASIIYFVVQIHQKTPEHINWSNMAWYKQREKAESAAETFKQQHPGFDTRVIEKS
jgi:hypothetical protein